MKTKLFFLCMMAWSIMGTLNASVHNGYEGSSVEDPSSDACMEISGDGLSITTNHPDFKIKVTRCQASGNTCIIDMVFENLGSYDVQVGYSMHADIAYDDEANQYGYNHGMKLAFGNITNFMSNASFMLYSEAPMKARIQITGVPVSAQMFRRVQFGFNCQAWGLNQNKPIILKNVPITHDGD